MEATWGPAPQQPPPPESRRRTIVLVALAAIAVVAILGGSAVAITIAVSNDEDPPAGEERLCDPEQSFDRGPPYGFDYQEVDYEVVEGLDADLRESGVLDWPVDAVAGREVIAPNGRRAGLAISIDAGPEAISWEYADGLVELARERNTKASRRDINIEGGPAEVVHLDSGVGRTVVVLANSHCRLVAVQGTDEGDARKIMKELVLAG